MSFNPFEGGKDVLYLGSIPLCRRAAIAAVETTVIQFLVIAVNGFEFCNHRHKSVSSTVVDAVIALAAVEGRSSKVAFNQMNRGVKCDGYDPIWKC